MVAALGVASLAAGFMVVGTAGSALGDGTVPEDSGQTKWFVCKYVGTPGDGERLQTGDNPLSVAAPAIKQSPIVVGSPFADDQGRSVVIGQDLRTNAEEPLPTCPATPGLVTPEVSIVDRCEVAEDSFSVVAQPDKFSYSVDGSRTDLPVTITFTALSGYVIGGANPVVLTAASWPDNTACSVPPQADVCTNIEGVQAEVPDGFTVEDGVCAEIKGDEAAKPTKPAVPKPAPVAPVEQPDEVLGTEEAVPTEVDAGLVGPTDTAGGTSGPLGQALMMAGLMLLVLAGTMQAGRRERGVHEA